MSGEPRILHAGTSDVPGIMTLVQSCYGDSYGIDHFYDRAELEAKISAGILRSVVAIAGNEIVGHMALVVQHPGAAVCEAGNTVVHPSHRGGGLMMQLAFALHQRAVDDGFLGYMQFPTTAHTIMQRASVAYGGIETGIMLSYIAADADYRSIERPSGRLAITVAYQPVCEAPPRNLACLPVIYGPHIEQLYSTLGLQRSLSGDAVATPGAAQLSERNNSHWRHLSLQVLAGGSGLLEKVTEAIARYQPATSYIDFAVDIPGVDIVVDQLRTLGFFYAGLLPEYSETDCLRLQAIHEDVGQVFEPLLANAAAQDLLGFIRADARAVGAH